MPGPARTRNNVREDCRQSQAETMYKVWSFFIIIAGFINSFGLAFNVRSEYIVLLLWIAAGPPGTPYEKD